MDCAEGAREGGTGRRSCLAPRETNTRVTCPGKDCRCGRCKEGDEGRICRARSGTWSRSGLKKMLGKVWDLEQNRADSARVAR